MKIPLHPSHPAVIDQKIHEILKYPERIIQFGTGVLLRGLPDFIIDQANKSGHFKGRIVVVKSTNQGTSDAFSDQGGLYTVCIRGWEDGRAIEQNHVISSISRVLSADQSWDTILDLAANPDLDILISNTTEIGIQLVPEDVRSCVPSSFPGKVLAYLYARYQAFSGDVQKGMIIIPTELISDNAKKLEHIILELAHLNHLESAFIDWLETANTFCNSLVDRIVPGKPQGDMATQIQAELPYVDELTIIAEPYALWAIEGDESLLDRLSFCRAGAGASLHSSIEKFKELKLRLLNGTHSITCALAFLSGFKTVKQAMADPEFNQWIQEVALNEIAPAIPSSEVPLDEAHRFASQVLDRFRNPYLDHFWISIALQYTQKLKLRILPVLEKYLETRGEVPPLLSLGFAAYLHLMQVDETATGQFQGQPYQIQDPMTANFATWYSREEPIVAVALRQISMWGIDLSKWPAWEEAVFSAYEMIQHQLDTQGILSLSALRPTQA